MALLKPELCRQVKGHEAERRSTISTSPRQSTASRAKSSLGWSGASEASSAQQKANLSNNEAANWAASRNPKLLFCRVEGREPNRQLGHKESFAVVKAHKVQSWTRR
jgi:hypothetical protein